MRLTTRSRYGLRMIVDIAMHGTDAPVRIKDISERQDITVKYLEKLAGQLKQAGYMSGKPGPKGGVSLSKSPKDITVGELISLLEGDICFVKCTEDPSVCDKPNDCKTHKLWADVTRLVQEKLNSITVHDLIIGGNDCLKKI